MSRHSDIKRTVHFNRQPRLVVEQISIPAGPRILASLYPVRVLVAWLKEPDDIGYLGGEHRIRLTTEEAMRYRHLIRDGNQARAALPKLVQGDVVSDLPEAYERHAVQWRGQPAAQPYIDEGWDIKLIRLSNIVSLQPLVSTEKCDSLMSVIHPDDYRSLAALALPLTSADYLQAGRLGDRYVLRNGYHRAYSLLRSGITQVPALVRNVLNLANLTLPPGTFAPRILDLDRPPVLADFQHPRLAATIRSETV
jgi:hypothetical protein